MRRLVRKLTACGVKLRFQIRRILKTEKVTCTKSLYTRVINVPHVAIKRKAIPIEISDMVHLDMDPDYMVSHHRYLHWDLKG